MNLAAPLRRIDPDGVEVMEPAALAGDRFSEAIVDGSMWWWQVFGATDSLLLLPDDELGAGFCGSSDSDFLQMKRFAVERTRRCRPRGSAYLYWSSSKMFCSSSMYRND